MFLQAIMPHRPFLGGGGIEHFVSKVCVSGAFGSAPQCTTHAFKLFLKKIFYVFEIIFILEIMRL